MRGKENQAEDETEIPITTAHVIETSKGKIHLLAIGKDIGMIEEEDRKIEIE